MQNQKLPRLVPTEKLAAYFQSRGIAYQSAGSLNLGFGHGNDQYRLYSYPAPADDETMGLFCEWHTEDFFEVDSGPHVAIGLRGPVVEDPHRGRGLAIGILASEVENPEDPEHPIQLFKGCPGAPGGPSFFVEDFSRNDGMAPISQWQLSLGKHLPRLQGHGVFRIDIHVAKGHVWAGVWKVTISQTAGGPDQREYTFLGQVACSDKGPGFSGDPAAPCPQDIDDRGRGNVFIGSGFADPDTNSRVENIYIAHWKNST
jgi:hypothetical protein